MKQFYTFLAAVLLTATTVAQVGINTDNPYPFAALDIVSTTGGLLVPRMTKAQRNQINVNDPARPADGLMIYQTDGTAGFYYYNGSSWEGYYSKTEVDELIANLQSKTDARVGDIRAGGVVFWVDPSDNRHGLVVAMSDVPPSVEWGCYGTDLPNVPNVYFNEGVPVGLGAEIGHGFNNTNDILNDCPTAPAALAARSLGAQWFLPSAKELNQMYINKDDLEAVDGFFAFSDYYWSSSEIVNVVAWFQSFSSGIQNNYFKNNTINVRAVRAF